MRQKLKGWFRLAVVTTPLACILPFVVGHPEKFNWYLGEAIDIYIRGWVVEPFLYGMANFIFWMLVGVFIKFAIPWVIDGFKNDHVKLRQ